MTVNSESEFREDGQDQIRRSVQRGVRDIEAGRFQDFDEVSLQALPAKLVGGARRRLDAAASLSSDTMDEPDEAREPGERRTT